MWAQGAAHRERFKRVREDSGPHKRQTNSQQGRKGHKDDKQFGTLRGVSRERTEVRASRRSRSGKEVGFTSLSSVQVPCSLLAFALGAPVLLV
jgi:hypothetical protein